MVQTLADMLDDQPNSSGRLTVWLRASTELPVGITQQNITSAGETMNKLATISNKRLAVGAGAVVVLAVLFGLHSWLGNTVIPKTTGVFYSHSVGQTLANQNLALADPMEKLYGKLGQTISECRSQAPKGIPLAVDCSAALQGYAVLPQDDAGKQRVLSEVRTIEAAIKDHGYHGGSNGVTLSSLVAGTYQGKDYSADAYYETVIDHRYSCVFDTTIAYANPKPAAISSRLWCTRTVNLLGVKWRSVYQSGNGSPVY
jgi:hypothetical protein